MDLDPTVSLICLVLFVWLVFHYRPDTTLPDLANFLVIAFVFYRVVERRPWELSECRAQGPTGPVGATGYQRA